MPRCVWLDMPFCGADVFSLPFTATLRSKSRCMSYGSKCGGDFTLSIAQWADVRNPAASGSTDKFGTTILTHLFCPHFGGKSSTEHHSASGFPPRSDEKIYANLRDCFISDSLAWAWRGLSSHVARMSGAIRGFRGLPRAIR